MITGTVTGREFKENRDGTNLRLLLQVQVTDSDDVQTVEYMATSGEDSNPPNGSKVLIVGIGSAYKIAIAADDNIEPTMLEGEKKLYSIEAGAIAAFINFLQSGIIELNGNADFAVRYNALETAFNQLQSDFDGHSHLYTPGTGTPTQTSGPPASTADITAAKVDTVKVP